MRWTIVKVFPVAFAGIMLVSAAFAQRPDPDLILFKGRIFTSNVSRPYVEAVAIRGERILAVGTSKEIVSLAGKETKRIDLAGRTVIPGINDAHLHLGVGPESYDLPLQGDNPKWQEVKDAIALAVTKAPKGTWIIGSFNTNVLENPQATRTALDELAPDHPVLLTLWGGHASLLNSLALKKLGVREDQPNPEGGRYARNQTDGRLTGMAFEFATLQLDRRYTALTSEQEAVKQLEGELGPMARWGITSVQDMASSIPADRCVELLKKSPPPIRVRVIWFGLTDEHGRLMGDGRAQMGHAATLVTVSGTKWILDGTPIERGGALRKPYADRPDYSGELNFSEKEMEDMLRESLRRDDQLMVHIAGDRTTETFLSAMEATGGKEVWAKRRVRIEHGDGVLPDLAARARKLGVVVVQNPIHFTLDDIFVSRYGADRANQFQPFRSLMDLGISVAIGSDGPWNPYLNIMLASTFGRHPSEAVSREQAVVAYTLTSAYAEFEEKDKGSLEPGKLADLAVLSQDIFRVPADDLPKTESVLTIVGGKIVYDAKALTTK